MATIKLYEKYNKEKLKEVLKCNNLPFKSNHDEEYKDKFLTKIHSYANKKYIDDKGVLIEYKQNNGFGRFVSTNGYQGFVKDVRKYIADGMYDDIDIENAHPTFLNKLMKEYLHTNRTLLDDYCEDRTKFLNEYEIEKEQMIKFINNENCIKQELLELHNKIYKDFLPQLKEKNKTLYKNIKKQRKKEKKDYNLDGAFLSRYLQNVENEIIQIVYQELVKKGYIVGSLIFDGLLVEKSDTIEEELESLRYIIYEKTGYMIKLSLKSMNTDWKPIYDEEDETTEEGENFSCEKLKRLYLNCEDDTDKQYLIEYLNKFVCFIKHPLSYGLRYNSNDEYIMYKNGDVMEVLRYGFKDIWKDSDDKLTYERFVFCPDEKMFKKGEYNLYKRPKMKKTERRLEEIAPLYYEYLNKVVADGDEDVYIYLVNYISKMVQSGKTFQLLVLMGQMGTGKSFFTKALKCIVGDQYYCEMKSIHDITAKFNALWETKIITSVEEIVAEAGQYHSIQSHLKSLTTEVSQKYEKKGIDSYMGKSFNNFILSTNEFNPVKITEDNRRCMVLYFSNCRLQDVDFFRRLDQEINDNVEELRGFFYDYPCVHHLNSIRVTTDAELQLLELNKSGIEKFLEDYQMDEEDMDENGLPQQIMYRQFLDFCREEHLKTIDIRYFGQYLKKYKFETFRKSVNNKKVVYIKRR